MQLFFNTYAVVSYHYKSKCRLPPTVAAKFAYQTVLQKDCLLKLDNTFAGKIMVNQDFVMHPFHLFINIMIIATIVNTALCA